MARKTYMITFILAIVMVLFSIECHIISTFLPISLVSQKETNLQFILSVEGKYLTLVLKKDRHYKSNYLQVRIDEKPLKMDEKKSYCFYEGKIRNDDESIANINVCNGLRGFIKYGNETLFIEPVEDDKTSWESLHAIKYINMKSDSHKCGGYKLMEFSPEQQVINRRFDANSDSQGITLELSVIVPYELFIHPKYCMSNVSKAIDFVTHIIYLSNFFFRPLKIIPLTMHLDIFTNNDIFPSFNNKTYDEDVLIKVVERRKNLASINESYDATILYTPFVHGSTTGLAYLNAICNYDKSTAFASASDDIYMVTTLAHEIGHLLGCIHSNNRPSSMNCTCADLCLMNNRAYKRHYKHIFWSQCDINDIKSTINSFGSCLLNVPTKPPIDRIYCGNNVIEEKEECDCGLPHECRAKNLDSCCDPITCKLMKGASCASSTCCQNCQFSKNSTPCYSNLKECFMGECDGKTENCEPMYPVKDNLPCNNNKDVCRNGICFSKNSQCEHYFGPKSSLAPPKCFEKINSLGEIFGNCGIDKKNSYLFKKCIKDDVYCGKIVCSNFSTNLQPNYQYYYHQNGCISAYKNAVKDNYEESAMVEDGTACGIDKICIKQKCVKTDKFWKLYSVKKCGHLSKIDNYGTCVCSKHANRIEGKCYYKKLKTSTKAYVILSYILFNAAFSVGYFLVIRVEKWKMLTQHFGYIQME